MTREELQKLISDGSEKAIQAAMEHFNKRQTDFQEKLLSGGFTVQAHELTPFEKRVKVGRFVRSVAAAKGDLEKAASIAKTTFGDEMVSKALTTSLEATGGAFVPEDLTTVVIEYLRPLSVVRRLNPTIQPMPNGNLSLPKITGGAIAGYRGESKNRKAQNTKTGNIKLSHKILDVTVPISKELLMVSAVSVDETITRDATRAMAVAEDGAFIRGDGTQFTPKGIKNWTLPANVITATGTSATDFANIVQDFKNLEIKLADSNVPLIEAAFILPHRTFINMRELLNTNGFPIYPELRMGNIYSATIEGLPKLRGYPVGVTNNIPRNLTVAGTANTTENYFANMADVVIGELTAIEVEYSTEATYVDSDGNLQSAFANGEAVVKLTARHDIGLRHDESIAYQQKVVY